MICTVATAGNASLVLLLLLMCVLLLLKKSRDLVMYVTTNTGYFTVLLLLNGLGFFLIAKIKELCLRQTLIHQKTIKPRYACNSFLSFHATFVSSGCRPCRRSPASQCHHQSNLSSPVYDIITSPCHPPF